MTFSDGERVGPYQIVSLIGCGGMGEVYKAHDTRLGRDVAIKVSTLAFDERFEREGRAVAALNHPNICQLYDVGALPSGSGFLVMEYIEGERLKGPMPLDAALRVARQIASALEEAHEKGIIHRDLKPGNVIVRADGTVKVLDFGLAKVAGMSAVVTDTTPTHIVATQSGVILGTAAYMAPEQARGRDVDKRADIWAFGVMLYELLTGRQLFGSEDLASTLAMVLKEQPDLSDAPPEVRPLLAKCLEKDPKHRLRDIADYEILIGTPAAAAVHAAPARWPWVAATLAGVAAAAAFAVLWLRQPAPDEAQRPVRARTAAGNAIQQRPYRDDAFARRPLHRVRCRGFPRNERAVAAAPGYVDGAPAAGNRGRHVHILVARQQVAGIFGRWQTQAHRHRRRSGGHVDRFQRLSGHVDRNLEPGRRHSVRKQRRTAARLCVRRRIRARDQIRSGPERIRTWFPAVST
jgi:predicted Ser/Thr protein kinase